ncbi:MAG: PilN domain-containing protein [Phycisphaeraceae bacterium]
MSFLPQDYVESRIQRRTNLICLTLFAIVMAAVVAAFLVTVRHGSEVKRLHTQINQDFEEAAKRLDQLQVLQDRKSQMMQKAQVTAQLLERVPRSLILSELTNMMPMTLSLTDLQLETHIKRERRPLDATALQEAKQKAVEQGRGEFARDMEVAVTDVELQLVGTAPTDVEVAQFMTALGQNPMFEDVNLVFSEQVVLDEAQARKFKIDIRLNQELDVQQFEPKMVKRGLKLDPMADVVAADPDGNPIPGTAPVKRDDVRPASDHR